jgi:hypothetical protein
MELSLTRGGESSWKGTSSPEVDDDGVGAVPAEVLGVWSREETYFFRFWESVCG